MPRAGSGSGGTITRRALLALVATGSLLPRPAGALGLGKIQRMGVIHLTGHHREVLDGLRQGLAELGLEEGKHIAFEVRETPYDSQAFEVAARDLERSGVDVIYAVGANVSVAVKRATTRIPVVFHVGADPVMLGLIDSIAKPGGRLTGVHALSSDLAPKRMGILKEMIPKLRRVVTIYNPGDPSSRESARRASEAARQLGLQLVEHHVTTSEDIRRILQDLRRRDGDAYFHTPGALVTSHAPLIIEAARSRKLPTMFQEQGLVAKGALASYGSDYREIGRVSAKHVQRVLAGRPPRDLPVERYDKVGLAINLRVARELGVTITQSLRVQADQVIQ